MTGVELELRESGHLVAPELFIRHQPDLAGCSMLRRTAMGQGTFFQPAPARRGSSLRRAAPWPGPRSFSYTAPSGPTDLLATSPLHVRAVSTTTTPAPTWHMGRETFELQPTHFAALQDAAPSSQGAQGDQGSAGFTRTCARFTLGPLTAGRWSSSGHGCCFL